jgi:glucose-6-phosphate 1-dehydrogenase
MSDTAFSLRDTTASELNGGVEFAPGIARRPEPLVLVIFGASGDLAHRKILPALAALAEHGSLPEQFAIVGIARSETSDDEFRRACVAAAGETPSPLWTKLVRNFRYIAGDYGDDSTFETLARVLEELDESVGTAGNRLYYLATIPSLFGVVACALGRHNLNGEARDGNFARLVVEKPFGTDAASALELDRDLHEGFRERQIFRIDHYLGKETVLNVLALRFANTIFEPIWSRQYVDHVQVTVAEDLGVEHRGNFYEGAGALRDIVQNHVMQVLSFRDDGADLDDGRDGDP